jgi:hypothetical protein
MNVRKFIAATARDALRKVKETLGPDAIILSNRGIPGGVEIMAVAARDMEMIVPTRAKRRRAANPRCRVARNRQPSPVGRIDAATSSCTGAAAAPAQPAGYRTARSLPPRAARSAPAPAAPTTDRERSTAGGGRGSRRSDGRDSHIAKDCRTATGRLCLGRGSACATDKDRDSSPHARRRLFAAVRTRLAG